MSPLVSLPKLCCSTKMKSRFRNWSDVRAFLAVAREGSTLAASRKLGVAQPTVARRIEVLEHETGLTLFERSTQGFRLTEAARALLPLAEAIESAASSFEARAGDLRRPRPIRITSLSANFSPRMVQILDEFSAMHPHIRFELIPGIKPLDLSTGEADIALRLTGAEPDLKLVCRKIGTARFTFYGAPSYAQRRGLPRSIDDLAGHSFVTFQRDDIVSRTHDWLSRRVSPDQIVMSYSEIELMKVAVRSGHGLGIINIVHVEADESAGTLIRCFEPPEEMSMQHLMLISPDAYLRPEVKEFARFFAPRYAAIFK